MIILPRVVPTQARNLVDQNFWPQKLEIAGVVVFLTFVCKLIWMEIRPLVEPLFQ